MWSKEERDFSFFYIYNHLFKLDFSKGFRQETSIKYDSNQIHNFAFTKSEFYEIKSSFKKLIQTEFTQNLDIFIRKFKPYLKNWNNTYLLVKAILLACLLEKKITGLENEKLIPKYIRLCQNYGDHKSVSVVHAVLYKLLENQEL